VTELRHPGIFIRLNTYLPSPKKKYFGVLVDEGTSGKTYVIYSD
jgi:hypothetical protein